MYIYIPTISYIHYKYTATWASVNLYKCLTIIPSSRFRIFASGQSAPNLFPNQAPPQSVHPRYYMSHHDPILLVLSSIFLCILCFSTHSLTNPWI